MPCRHLSFCAARLVVAMRSNAAGIRSVVWPPEGIPHVGQRPSSDRNARSQLPHASCDLRSASDLRHAASVSVSGTATSGSRLASTPGVVAPPECISAPGRYEKKIRFPKTRSARSYSRAPACQKRDGSATTTENGVYYIDKNRDGVGGRALGDVE